MLYKTEVHVFIVKEQTKIYYFKHMYTFTNSLITFTKLALNL